jgi:hypothetical protein
MTGDSVSCDMMNMSMDMPKMDTVNKTAGMREEQLLIAQSMLKNATEYLNTILNDD